MQLYAVGHLNWGSVNWGSVDLYRAGLPNGSCSPLREVHASIELILVMYMLFIMDNHIRIPGGHLTRSLLGGHALPYPVTTHA